MNIKTVFNTTILNIKYEDYDILSTADTTTSEIFTPLICKIFMLMYYQYKKLS